MAKFKTYNYDQMVMIPITLKDQLEPGTMEYAIHDLVDDKHQIIVNAEAFGNGQDHDNLEPMMDCAKKNMQTIGKGEDYFEGKQLSADCNYHNKENLAKCKDEGLDAYIPDSQFRKRDVRFAEQDRFKDGINPRKNVKKKTIDKANSFAIEDFTYDESNKCYVCPNQKILKRNAHRHRIRNLIYDIYRAREADCSACKLRLKCLNKKVTKRKHLVVPLERAEEVKKKFDLVDEMKKKIDTRKKERSTPGVWL